MDTRDSILTEFYNSEALAQMLQRVCKYRQSWRQDAKQYLFLVLCGLTELKLNELHQLEGLTYYAAQILRNMIRGNRSEFYRQQQQSEELTQSMVQGTPADDNEYQHKERTYALLTAEIARMPQQQQEAINLLTGLNGAQECYTAAGVAAYTGRPVRSTSRDVERGKRQLREAVGGRMAP